MLVAVVQNLPSIADKFIRAEFHPRYSDAIRRKEQGREQTKLKVKEFNPRMKLRRKSTRTNYAFAHQEGFGKIVMSPASFLRKKFKTTRS